MHTDASFVQPHGFKPKHQVAHWKSCHVALVHAMKEYLFACEELFDTPGHPQNVANLEDYVSVQAVSQSAEEVFPDIDDVLDGLIEARWLIRVQRNCSITAVPIRRLPDELLRYIFFLGNENHFAFTSSDSTTHPLAPVETMSDSISFSVLVSHVCHHWRSVALSSAMLWRHIGIHSASSIKRTRVLLDRSQGCKLFIRVDGGHEILEFIKPHLQRCFDLDIGLTNMTRIQELIILAALSSFRGMPGVRNLTLRLPRVTPSHKLKTLRQIGYMMHSLRGINVLRLYGPLPSSNFYFLQRLTELTLVSPWMAVTAVETILSSCPKLEVLKLGESKDSWRFPSVGKHDSKPFRLPCLRHLSIKRTSLQNAAAVLANVDAPLLHTLQIHTPPWKSRHYNGDNEYGTVVQLSDLFLQSTFSLTIKELELSWVLDNRLLQRLLVSLPNVETLTLISSSSVVVLGPIPKAGGVDFVCPRLTSLTVFDFRDTLYLRDIQSVVQSRLVAEADVAASIECLAIMWGDLIGEQDEVWFRKKLVYYRGPSLWSDLSYYVQCSINGQYTW
ncbi:hypothetical protein BOTBODRAFT_173747 [Botryobasidium botryosum FD-172 SS1]|uniref:Uncharacterized protein n=1 Tax=Botryobasidium botryosum (strain FD-172 SS1) TaxID=930990 RepID=A0A067MUV4_BOTB1|nr:hypothetical protein BOTBODRAFT_173747 [Botryobasidium botryosum FD-172 SS1]